MSNQINLRQIAERAGCSASTVSRVLGNRKSNIKISEKTRERVLQVCRELDYQPSIHGTRFFSKTSKMIGFLMPAWIALEDDNLARGMSRVYAILKAAGYRLLPLSVDDKFISENEHLNLYKRKEIDALIIWGLHGNEAWVDDLYENRMPFMLLTNGYKNYPTVSCDNALGITAMVDRCLDKGAKRLVYIAAGAGDCGERRKNAFLAKMTNGLQYQVIEKGFQISDGIEAVAEILSYKPDAVICGNDRVAVGVQKGLLQHGITLPDDMMITGADNIELAEYCPVPLTTFDQMASECAEKCAKSLLDFLQNGVELKSISIPPEIIERQSV